MSCKDTLAGTSGAPKLTEKFSQKASAGHVAWLELEVHHLAGERILPAGIALTADSEEGKALLAAQFRWPDPQSATAPQIEQSTQGDQAVTKVRVPFVPLPAEPGRVELELPQLPIAVARASGKLETLCTASHRIVVEDALANQPNAALKADPEPRPQREVWTLARDVTLGLLLALPLLVLLLWALNRLRKNWKPRIKVAPALPPWELALAQLSALEAEKLLEKEQFEAYLDRVSDTLRQYLGARYGFEGLESTTRETLRQLSERASQFAFEREVRTILQRADLVKFAKRLPELEECRDAMAQTVQIVQRTKPTPVLDPRVAATGAAQ
jgi:hypothetical protein